MQDYKIKQVAPVAPVNDEEKENADALMADIPKIGVSDGSVDPISGAAAYARVLTTRSRLGKIKRKRPMRANEKYMNSYRAELGGVCNLLQYIVKNGMQGHEIELWCDNKGVVDRLSNEMQLSLTDMTAAESDLLKVARDQLRQMPRVSIQHV